MSRNSFYDGSSGNEIVIDNSAASASLSETNALASAGAAATSETNAANSASAALTSENAASGAAAAQTASELAETNANTSETNALASKNAAALSASAASTSEGNAQSSEDDATIAQTAAELAETNATTSETNALASKNAAATSASNALTSEGLASADAYATALDKIATNADVVLTHADEILTRADTVLTAADKTQTALDRTATGNDKTATNADVISTAADRSAVETLYDNFDDRYLGTKTADPTLDNDGNALLTGAIYFNSTVDHTRFYNGAAWEDPEATSTSAANTATTQASNAASSASAALVSEGLADDDRVLTNADVVLTHADVVLTHADVVLAEADKVQTALDRTATGNDKTATNADVILAAASKTAAEAAYDSFDDRYLGPKATDPTLDNDGDALLTGSLYFNSSLNEMKAYSGSAWLTAYVSLTGALLDTNNLSDLDNIGTAVTNLGLVIGTNVQAFDVDTAKLDVVQTFSAAQTFSDAIITTKTAVISDVTATSVGTVATVIFSMPIATYRSAKLIISADQTTKFMSMEVMVMHDGTSSFHNEYGVVFSTDDFTTITSDVSGGNVRILAACNATSDIKVSAIQQTV